MAQAKSRSITRRSLVAGSVAAIPVAALASTHVLAREALVDPILAVIDSHRRAYADVVSLLAAQDATDKALRETDKIMRPVLEARLADLCAAEGPLGLAEMEAAARLAGTVPETFAGAAAVLRYVRGLFADDYPMYEEDGYRALLLSTECAICRSAGLSDPQQALIRRHLVDLGGAFSRRLQLEPSIKVYLFRSKYCVKSSFA